MFTTFIPAGGVPSEMERPPQQLLQYHAGPLRHRDVDRRHTRMWGRNIRDTQTHAMRLLHVLSPDLDPQTGQAAHCFPKGCQPQTPGDASAVHVQRGDQCATGRPWASD